MGSGTTITFDILPILSNNDYDKVFPGARLMMGRREFRNS